MLLKENQELKDNALVSKKQHAEEISQLEKALKMKIDFLITTLKDEGQSIAHLLVTGQHAIQVAPKAICLDCDKKDFQR